MGGSLRGKGARSLRDLTRSLRAAYVRHVISLLVIPAYEMLTGSLRVAYVAYVLHFNNLVKG